MANLTSNLRALAICYRIVGGFVALIISVVTFLELSPTQLSNGMANLLAMVRMLWMIPLLALVIVGATATVLLFEVASSLQNRERRVFCLVVAWLMCAFFPLGTVLGVFTILLLTRDEAERAFAESSVDEVNVEDVPETRAERTY